MSGGEFILETRDLTKEFKGFVAVSKVNLAAQHPCADRPNGAGKTTCFNLLTKFLIPTSGQIIFDGTDITPEKPAAIARTRRGIRSFQISAVFPHLSVLENVRVRCSASSAPRSTSGSRSRRCTHSTRRRCRC